MRNGEAVRLVLKPSSCVSSCHRDAWWRRGDHDCAVREATRKGGVCEGASLIMMRYGGTELAGH